MYGKVKSTEYKVQSMKQNEVESTERSTDDATDDSGGSGIRNSESGIRLHFISNF